MPILADQLATALSVEIPEDLRAWLDGARRDGIAAGAYIEDGEIDGVLEPGSAAVWGGQHLPDAIPVLGNGGGDVLLLRFDWDGRPREFVEWLHEGGFWRPFGHELSEALVLDALLPDAYSVDEELDLDALLARPGPPGWSFACARLAEQGRDPRDVLRPDMGLEHRIAALLEPGIGGVAPRQQLAGLSLLSPLSRWCRRHGGQRLAREIGLDGFHVMAPWVRGGAAVPEEHRVAVAGATGIPVEELGPVSLEVALDHALAILEERIDLAWPHALVADARLRAGDLDGSRRGLAEAVGAPASSLWLPASAWPGWTPMSFLRERLATLLEGWPEELPGRAWAEAIVSPERSAGFAADGMRRHWLSVAEAAEAREDFRGAYEAYWLMGWDDFHTDHMDKVLERLERVARLGGSPLANVARLHLESLRALESRPRASEPDGSDLAAVSGSRPGCLGALLGRR